MNAGPSGDRGWSHCRSLGEGQWLRLRGPASPRHVTGPSRGLSPHGSLPQTPTATPGTFDAAGSPRSRSEEPGAFSPTALSSHASLQARSTPRALVPFPVGSLELPGQRLPPLPPPRGRHRASVRSPRPFRGATGRARGPLAVTATARPLPGSIIGDPRRDSPR